MISRQLIAASTSPLLLSILAEGESYGYAIIQRVQDLSGGEIRWTEGMLYPVLHRLERKGCVSACWREGTNGRSRKYYRLTARGRKLLDRERTEWSAVQTTFAKLWEERPCPT